MITRVDDRSPDTSMSEIVIEPCAAPSRARGRPAAATTISTATMPTMRRGRWRMALLLDGARGWYHGAPYLRGAEHDRETNPCGLRRRRAQHPRPAHSGISEAGGRGIHRGRQ